MPEIHEHHRIADRLIRQAQTAAPGVRDALIAEAHARATLALVEEAELGNLIALLAAIPDDGPLRDRMEHPLAALIIRHAIRRRLGLFPGLTDDGETANGGDS